MLRSQDPKNAGVDHYGAQYGHFGSPLYAEIRAETFGQDIDQNEWLAIEEQDLFLSWLALTSESRLLDVACGSGGPTLQIARITGCQVQGVDIHEQGIAAARARAEDEGLTGRAAFDRLDGGQPLPFPGGAFDALLRIDAVNHLLNRRRIFEEWARVLRPGAQLVSSDPIVVTGALIDEEIAIRSSIGFFLFVPTGTDEELLAETGFAVVEIVDRTENMARIAERWHAARAARSDELRHIEGDDAFDGQQRLFEVAARLASERRLSQFAFHARRV